MKIEKSFILSAFSEKTIGTKVVDQDKFMEILQKCLEDHDPAQDRQEGQHFIPMPEEAHSTVSAGVGQRTDNLNDYVLRFYRGQVDAYLRREKAAEVESLAAIVYTIASYLADSDIGPEEAERIRKSGATHVLVAVLATAGPKAPLSPKRLIHNLAGGNREVAQWTAEEIREKAAESKAYHDKWCVVAD